MKALLFLFVLAASGLPNIVYSQSNSQNSQQSVRFVGTIKWYMEAKGYGLITGDDGREVTVHFSAIQGGGNLREGQTVEYSVVKRRAANVVAWN